MYRIIAALFFLLASAAASSAQGLFPSVWQSQRGALLKILAINPAGNFTGVFVSGPAGTCPGVPYDLTGAPHLWIARRNGASFSNAKCVRDSL